jgi:hypothetical protein
LNLIPRFAFSANREVFMGWIKVMEDEGAHALIIAADLAAPAFIFNGAQLGSLSPRYDI